jgi:hypothetical protein
MIWRVPALLSKFAKAPAAWAMLAEMRRASSRLSSFHHFNAGSKTSAGNDAR